MSVGLIQQTKTIVLPVVRIERLGASKVRNSLFTEKAVDFPAHDERDRLRGQLDHFVHVV